MRGIRQKILIVDNTSANMQILNEVLQRDYDILFASNATDIIRIAQQEEPDLILLEIMIPEMVNFELCAEIKSDPLTGQIPLIFITAISDAADEAKCLEYGAIDYITKPIFPPIAKARIKNHLELKRNRGALRWPTGSQRYPQSTMCRTSILPTSLIICAQRDISFFSQ